MPKNQDELDPKQRAASPSPLRDEERETADADENLDDDEDFEDSDEMDEDEADEETDEE